MVSMFLLTVASDGEVLVVRAPGCTWAHARHKRETLGYGASVLDSR
jgi:hypothetical protein